MNKLGIKLNEEEIQRALGKNLYSDKYCFITEVVSNAKDSHTRAGVNKPIQVSITKEESEFYGANEYWWKCKDEGTGLSKEELIERVFTLLNSDKKNEKDSIGNKGIGKIAFSAYNNECYYKCIKDGKGVKAKMVDIEYQGISYDILEEFDAEDEPNGVEFKIKLNTSISAFENEMFRKLAYFGDIQYNILGRVADNNYKIYRNDLYQISDFCEDNLMHLTIDDVYYPINYIKIGMTGIKIPVAVRFHLRDNVEVSTTREAVIYSEHFISLLKERINSVIEDISDRFKKDLEKSKNLLYFFHKDYNNISIRLGERTILLSNLPSKNKLPQPHLNGVEKEVVRKFLSNLYLQHEHKGKINRYGGKYSKWGNVCLGDILSDIIVLVDEFPGRKRIDYYKWKYPDNDVIFIKKNELSLKKFMILEGTPNEKRKEIYRLTGINVLRNFIEDWRTLEKELYKDAIVDRDVKYPKEFLDGRKTVREKKIIKKEEGEITVKTAKDFIVNTGSSNPCKYENEQLDLNTAHRNKYLTIYGENIHLEQLNKVVGMFQFNNWRKTLSKSIRIIIISKKDINKIEKIHNYMHVNEFIKGDNTVFRREVTKYVIAKLIKENQFIFRQSNLIKDHLSFKFGEHLIKLSEYSRSSHGGGVFIEEAVKLVEENNYWDWSIWETYLNVQKNINKLKWMEWMEPKVAEYNPIHSGILDCIKDLCKYYKFKMNWQNYGKSTESNNRETIEF